MHPQINACIEDLFNETFKDNPPLEIYEIKSFRCTVNHALQRAHLSNQLDKKLKYVVNEFLENKGYTRKNLGNYHYIHTKG
tara:strand:+ start:154 stop:396 length:243 start_codon:yes stop_codon:yes gene_type:complete